MKKMQQFQLLCKGELSNKSVLFNPILMHFAARYAGHTYGEFASDYKVLVKAGMKTLDDFDLDMVGLISDPYRETAAFGASIEYQKEGVPKCLNHIVKTMEDVKSLKNPDLLKSERTFDRIRGAAEFTKILKGEVPVFGWIEGPLAEACTLAGVGEMLVQLMVEPDFCNLLLDKCLITAKDFARLQIDNGCDIIGIGDAICSQIDISTYDAFVKDRHRELISYIQGLGALVKLHICGDITHLLPSLAEINPDILDLDWQVSFGDARNIMGMNTILCGNINPVDIEQNEAPAVFNLSRKLIDCLPEGRFILSGGCEITVNTPPVNLLAMRNASHHA
jgi:uroporphyrinogen decarboxylase